MEGHSRKARKFVLMRAISYQLGKSDHTSTHVLGQCAAVVQAVGIFNILKSLAVICFFDIV